MGGQQLEGRQLNKPLKILMEQEAKECIHHAPILHRQT